jgi:tRNA(adenine34) deaminase
MDLHYIDTAIELAKQARDMDEFPVGAMVIRSDGDIVGKGFNQKESLKDPTAHAEVLAIRDAVKQVGDWRLTNATLLTTLEPCPMCLGAIIQARISTIVYLAKDIRWGACGSVMDFSNHDQLNHQCEVHYIPNDDVVRLMKDFFKDKR